MKSISPVSLLMCALVITGGAIGGASKAIAVEPSAIVPSTLAQEAEQDRNSAPSLSGSWQMSWTAPNGNQRQATLEIKQDGSKLSGSFEGERGSVPLKGSAQGNQVTFSVKARKRQASFTGTVDGDKMSGTGEQGGTWTATRQ